MAPVVAAGTTTASVIFVSGRCRALSAAHAAGVAAGRPPKEACPAINNASTALTVLLLLRAGRRCRGRHVEGDAGVHHLLPRLIAPGHRLGRIRVRLVA